MSYNYSTFRDSNESSEGFLSAPAVVLITQKPKKRPIDYILPKEDGDVKVYWALRTLLVTLIVSILCAGCESWIMANENTVKNTLLQEQPTSTGNNANLNIWLNFKIELTYHAVFLASIGFLFFVVWDGVLHRNSIQCISVNFYLVGLLVYSVLQILQTDNDLNTIRPQLLNANVASNSGYFLAAQILLPCIIGIFIPIYGFLSYKMYGEFGWRAYRISGGAPKVTKAFNTYHMFLLLLKYSVFAGCGFLVIDVILTKVSANGKILIPVLGFIVGIITVVTGFYGVRYEHAVLVIVHIVGTLGIFAYMIYRMVTSFHRGGSDFQRTKIPFLAFGVMCALLLLAIVCFAVLCLHQFGVGVRYVLDQEKRKQKGNYVPPPIDLTD
ncbi:hypothetical protein HDU79_011235 [Rhizoclosmatium sp. JEL0117]|nr:hypothetical protein HDU79_011235 [Rhizoclosmatium sp. JEL0117]